MTRDSDIAGPSDGTMRAMVLPAFGGGFVEERRARPRPGPGEVVVRVIACGAGLTLEHIRQGAFGGGTPRVLGHEYSGEVAEIGVGVAGWSVGDLVTGTFYLICGRCPMCVSGHETLCTNLRGLVGIAVDGAFADYIAVPAINLVRLPDGIDPAVAGIVADAVATPYHVATDRLGIKAGDRIAVSGAGGGLGVHMLAVVRAFGGHAIAVERDPAKLAALRVGGHADAVIDAATPDWVAAVRDAAGGRLRGYVDTVGSTATLGGGVAALGPRGTLVVLGFQAGAELRADPLAVLLGEQALVGTRYATRAEIAAALDLVREGRVRPVIGARFPLSRLSDAFAAISENRIFGRIVIDVAPVGGAA